MNVETDKSTIIVGVFRIYLLVNNRKIYFKSANNFHNIEMHGAILNLLIQHYLDSNTKQRLCKENQESLFFMV
jgi:hypothetical protein